MSGSPAGQRADFMPPFEFYAWVLGADGGRRLLARLGPDAVEPIEAFLGQALAYEQGHPAALEGFLHWLGLGSDELKRDPEQARDVVRVDDGARRQGAGGADRVPGRCRAAQPRAARRLLWPDATRRRAAVLARGPRPQRRALTDAVGREERRSSRSGGACSTWR